MLVASAVGRILSAVLLSVFAQGLTSTDALLVMGWFQGSIWLLLTILPSTIVWPLTRILRLAGRFSSSITTARPDSAAMRASRFSSCRAAPKRLELLRLARATQPTITVRATNRDRAMAKPPSRVWRPRGWRASSCNQRREFIVLPVLQCFLCDKASGPGCLQAWWRRLRIPLRFPWVSLPHAAEKKAAPECGAATKKPMGGLSRRRRPGCRWC